MRRQHPDDYFEEQPEFSAYKASRRGERVEGKNLTDDAIRASVDGVEPELKGCVNVVTVWRALRCCLATMALVFALRLVLPDEHVPRGDPARLPDLARGSAVDVAEWQKRRRRKHLPPGEELHCSRTGQVAVEHLMRTSQLFEPVTDRRDIIERAGAFLVAKSNGRHRTICDARPANARIDTSRLPSYSIPTIEVIRQVVANVASAGDPFYIVSTDWRNAFFQVPLAERLKGYCVHYLSAFSQFVWATTLPMGLTISPFIMSALSWATILYDFGRNPVPGLDTSDLPHSGDPDDPSWQVFPQWFPLACGGGIFVIIDNIFVITRNKATAEALLDRIVRNAHDWRLAFKLEACSATKYQGYHELSVEEKIRLVRAECFHEMVPGVAHKGVVFCGVRWFPTYYHVEVNTERDGGFDPRRFMTADTWRSSRRELMAFGGRLGWHRRVTCSYSVSDPLGAFVHGIHRRAVPADASDGAAWKEIIEIRDSEFVSLAQQAWHERQTSAQRPVAYRPQQATFGFKLQCATDASSSFGLIAAVVLSAVGNYRSHEVRRYAEMPLAEGSAISHRELQGIILGVQACKARAREEGKKLDLITLACDNQNAIAWATSLRHYGEVVPGLLQQLLDELSADGHTTRLYVVFVGTNANVADPYSRGETQPPSSFAEGECRLSLSQVVLWHGQACAEGMWRVSGGMIGRRRERE
jgi:hypothetical protein